MAVNASSVAIKSEYRTSLLGGVIVKIIIIGCGKVGEELAAELSREENDIMIIDKDESVVNDLCAKYDVMGTVGNGASYSVQLEAEVQDADLMIAVTGSDELNLLCCLTAKKAGNCSTIARIRNPEYNAELDFLKEELGLAMVINQEQTAAREIARVLKFPTAIEIDTFAKGRIELLRFKIPQDSVLDGMNLYELHSKLKSNVLVCTVEHEGTIVIPNGDRKLYSGDVISIVADPKTEDDFFKKIGLHTNKVRNVIIVGGGDIAYYLAEILSESGMGVKLIERRLERCEQLCERLTKTTVIHGDGSNQQLLMEEGMETTDGFVALTDFDEENVILSLYARKIGVRKVVTKINRIAFDEVLDTLDLDTTIHPRSLTAEYIIQYVRARKNSFGSNVETLHWIVEHKAEALEFHIQENFSRRDIPLQDLRLKPNILLACINRGGKVILPRGRDILKTGDTVIVVTTIPGLNSIQDIFAD